MQSIINAFVGSLSSSNFEKLPDSEKEKFIKAMSTEKVSNTVGDEIFDYYFTNNKDSVSDCMKKHIYDKGEDCYEPRMNSMFKNVPTFVSTTDYQDILNKIKLEDYVSDIDRYNYILERAISDNIKKHFLKDNGKINIDRKSISDSLFNGYVSINSYIHTIGSLPQKKLEEAMKQGLEQFKDSKKLDEFKEKLKNGTIVMFLQFIGRMVLAFGSFEKMFKETFIKNILSDFNIYDITSLKFVYYYLSAKLYTHSVKNKVVWKKINDKWKKSKIEKHFDNTTKAYNDMEKTREQGKKLFNLILSYKR